MWAELSAVDVHKQSSKIPRLCAWAELCCVRSCRNLQNFRFKCVGRTLCCRCSQTELQDSTLMCMSRALCCRCRNTELKWCMCEQRSAVYVVKQRSQKLHAWTKICCICCQTEISKVACVNKGLLYMLSNRDLKSCMREQRCAAYIVKQRFQMVHVWTKICCICCQTEISKVACVNKDLLHMLSNRDLKSCMREQRSAVQAQLLQWYIGYITCLSCTRMWEV
jgi:hypothetical protein